MCATAPSPHSAWCARRRSTLGCCAQYDKTKLFELVRASFREVIAEEYWEYWEANARSAALVHSLAPAL